MPTILNKKFLILLIHMLKEHKLICYKSIKNYTIHFLIKWEVDFNSFIKKIL